MTGAQQYTADIRLDNALHVKLLSLACAHARILSIHREDAALLARRVRVTAIAVAVVQGIAFGVASTVPLLAPLRLPLIGIASLLTLGVVLLWFGYWRAWTASTIAASVVLLVGILTVGTPWIASHVSTRDAAAVVVANRRPGEALLAEWLSCGAP